MKTNRLAILAYCMEKSKIKLIKQVQMIRNVTGGRILMALLADN